MAALVTTDMLEGWECTPAPASGRTLGRSPAGNRCATFPMENYQIVRFLLPAALSAVLVTGSIAAQPVATADPMAEFTRDIAS